jgi:hypothetical protein
MTQIQTLANTNLTQWSLTTEISKFRKLTEKGNEPRLLKAVETAEKFISAGIKIGRNEEEAIRAYIERNSTPLYRYDPNNEQFLSSFKKYLSLHLGFNLGKDGASPEILNAQIIEIMKVVGEQFKTFSWLEIFTAIKFALKTNPAICKSYDPKDGISSFNSVYFAQIVKYYEDNKQDIGAIIMALREATKQSDGIEAENSRNLLFIRNEIATILSNYYSYFYHKQLHLDIPQYIETLYEFMKNHNFIDESTKLEIWASLKEEKNPEKRIINAKKQVIIFSFEKIKNERKRIRMDKNESLSAEYLEENGVFCYYEQAFFTPNEMACAMGFFTKPLPRNNVGVLMDREELLKQYMANKGLISLFPLKVDEFHFSLENQAAFKASLSNKVRNDLNLK